MKKKVISLLLVLALAVGICPAAFAEEKDELDSTDTVVAEISREEYIEALAKTEGISYEEADMLDWEQSAQIGRSTGEVIRYVTLEKKAGAITNGSEYIQNVNISVNAKYLYDKINKEYLELMQVSAPYVYLPGITSDRFTFDHGDFSIEKNSIAMSTVVVLGTFQVHQPGVTIGIGGNILSVSAETGGCIISTKPITLKAIFTLADCK